MLDIEKVIRALNSKTRRKVLRILASGPKTVKEVSKELKTTYFINLKYRESVFKALEKTVDAQLVEKYYERERGLVYKLRVEQINIDLTDEKVRQNGHES